MKIFRALFLAGLLGASVGYSADVVINPTTDAATIELGTLSDVADLSGAASGEVFEYNGTKWTNATASAGGNPVSTNDVCVVQFDGNDTYTHSGNRTLEFDTIVHDSGGNFNTGTYTYTAPESRMYFVSLWARATGNGNRRSFRIYAKGSYQAITDYQQSYGTYSMYECSCILFLEAGDTVYTIVYPYGADVAMLGAGVRSKLMIVPIGE